LSSLHCLVSINIQDRAITAAFSAVNSHIAQAAPTGGDLITLLDPIQWI